jgi:hypothetical protein
MPIFAPEGYLDITNATLRGSEIITTSNVGIMNANPTRALSVGSNLHVSAYSSNVVQVNGNVVAQGLKLGFIEVLPSYDLSAVSNVGNVTLTTIQFSNATTAFVADSNIEVGTANLFVDTQTGRVGVGTDSPSKTLDVNGDATISGNLTVSGTTTVVNTENLSIKDPIIELGRDNVADPEVDLGLIMTRPSGEANVAMIYDESADSLEIGHTLNSAQDSTITMDTANALAVNIHGSLDVSSNLEVGTANLFVDTTTGNVGVGTTNPTSNLHVVGKAYLPIVARTPDTIELSEGFTVSGNYAQTRTCLLLEINTNSSADNDMSEYAGTIDLHIVAQRSRTSYNVECFNGQLHFVAGWNEESDSWQVLEFIQETKAIQIQSFRTINSVPRFKYKYIDRKLQIYIQYDTHNYQSKNSFVARVTSDNLDDITSHAGTAIMETGTDVESILGVSYGNGGNVGIGTTDPTSSLHVTNQGGTFNLGGSLRNQYNSVGVTAASVTGGYNTGSGPTNNGDGSYTWTLGGGDTNGAINLGYTATANEQIKITFTAKTTDTTSPTFTFENPSFNVIGGSQTLTANYVTYTIYATLPSNGGGLLFLRVYADNITWNALTIERADVFSGGNVGIGTTVPQDNFHIYSSEAGGTQLKIQNANTSGDTRAGLFLQTRNSNNFALQFTPSSDSIIFDNKGQGGYVFYQKDGSDTTNLSAVIDKDGNVGIGATNPQAKLDTRGDAVFDTGKDDTTLTGLLNYSSTQSAIDVGVNQGASAGSITASTDINPPPGVAGDVIAKYVNSHTTEVYTTQFAASPLTISTGDVIYFGMWVYATLDVDIDFYKFGGSTQGTFFTATGNSKWTWYERTITSSAATSSPEFRIDNNTPGRTYYFTGFTIRKNPSQTTGLPFTPRYSPTLGRGSVLSTQTLVAGEAAIKTLTGNVGIGTATPQATLDVNGIIHANGGQAWPIPTAVFSNVTPSNTGSNYYEKNIGTQWVYYNTVSKADSSGTIPSPASNSREITLNRTGMYEIHTASSLQLQSGAVTSHIGLRIQSLTGSPVIYDGDGYEILSDDWTAPKLLQKITKVLVTTAPVTVAYYNQPIANKTDRFKELAYGNNAPLHMVMIKYLG